MIAPTSRVRLVLRTLTYFRADWPRIALLLGLISLSTLIGLAQVWPLAILVDAVLTATPRSGWMQGQLHQWLPGNQPGQIALLAAAAFSLRLLQEIGSMIRSLVSLRVMNGGLLRIRCDLFRKLQALNLSYHRTTPQGDTIFRLCNDTSGGQSILSVSIDVCVAAVTLLAMFCILLSRNVELTLVAIAVVPLLVAINVGFGRALQSRSRNAREIESRFTSTVQRSVASISLMQAFCREPVEFGQFRGTAGASLNAWSHYHWHAAFYRLCVGTVFGAATAVMFGYGGYLVYHDQFLAPQPGGMTVGELMVFLTYLGMFYDPLCKLTGAGAGIQVALTSMERVYQVLDLDLVVADADDAVELPQQPRTLALRGVGFGYSADKPVLRDVDVTIKPGEMVAFVGSSGVGKSTLLNLLPRFFDPLTGQLQLDEIDIRKIKLRDLRRHIALVLQESVILPTTVAENIAYGSPNASLAQIREAAEMAGAASFIDDLPQQYQTPVVEGGQNLSGGQRQRLAIARALLTQAPIVVLDEPTSALDPWHEQRVTQALRSLKRQRTVVIVSHRLSTVVDCDQIFVMQEGRIVERGTHAELLDRGGVYFDMASAQQLTGHARQAEPQAILQRVTLHHAPGRAAA